MYDDLSDDTAGIPDMTPPAADAAPEERGGPNERDQALVSRIIKTIKSDKAHHEKAFKRMRRDMMYATYGADDTWPEDCYRANICGRHVKQKTAALYAKNPRIVARRRETLDFAVWDENPGSLELAYQTVAAATQLLNAAAAAPATVDGLTGEVISPEPTLPPGLEQAREVLADFQQGMMRRQFATRYGRTLEVLFNQALREQQPLDFKRGMKTVVRRACTTGVGYVVLGFQRVTGPRPGCDAVLADHKERLDHLRNLIQEAAQGELDDISAEIAELEHGMQAALSEPEQVFRAGLVFEYPESTKVIPDKRCKQLQGFVGAERITIERYYTVEKVKEEFGVDLKDSYTGYSTAAGETREIGVNHVLDGDYEWIDPSRKKKDLVCCWEYYDKPSGLVYYVADGYPGFLRPPSAPYVYVERFWPIFALTFNAVENEKELFPPSDVSLMISMQQEHNRSRQGKREHRKAARPRWVYSSGADIDEEDMRRIKDMQPFDAVAINMPPDMKIADTFQAFPVPGVDPNLYDTNEIFTDTQLVVGTQEAQFGGVSKATATESAIAANATQASDNASIDELDGFLSTIARAAGQILQREMSAEHVMRLVGPGAVWPDVSMADIAEEVHLEIEAGSSGRPNQAVEIANFQRLAPILVQLPNIEPMWLARQALRRLDDRLDLTDAIAAGIPSIVAMNQQRQVAPADAAAAGDDPNAQGAEGENNAQTPPEPSGTGPAFGSNQTEPAVDLLL